MIKSIGDYYECNSFRTCCSASSACHHLTFPLGHRFLASLQNSATSAPAPVPPPALIGSCSCLVFCRLRIAVVCNPGTGDLRTVENVQGEIYLDLADSALTFLSRQPESERPLPNTFFSPTPLIARIKARSPSHCSSAQQQYHTFFQCLTDHPTSTTL
ncbi:hypothetical protein N7510_002093 [Penicillium lagena]|uniref:uncharacterized protein n=1 Tax=Penicillium lagena TaxID=94218 RepID=UPI002542635F|nr:uncharacterized protein N7510_002093 [Penicillium lagena]KAJ5625784.1 hypothetical protein N7510_002093 [Penicillium lagena]